MIATPSRIEILDPVIFISFLSCFNIIFFSSLLFAFQSYGRLLSAEDKTLSIMRFTILIKQVEN